MLNQGLDQFESLRVLHQSENSVVYKGMRISDKLPVVIKVYSGYRIGNRSSLDLDGEIRILKLLDSPFVVKLLAVSKDNPEPFLVFEDDNLTDLKSLFGDKPLPVDQFIDIAMKIVQALADIHLHGIVHCDINPTNIIFSEDSGILKIIDFEQATRIKNAKHGIESRELIFGTLDYISPEQSGRTNRSIDYRSDFYSLGATFFRLLIGVPPFLAKDPAEILYSHLALNPESLHRINPEIPKTLSDVVLKLLNKNPEDRYQSLSGLSHDLMKIKDSQVQAFEIGQEDFARTLLFPEKIYGREKEKRLLRESFNKSTTGAKEFVFCTGESGIGKSVLVHDILPDVLLRGGVLVFGKYDQQRIQQPYSAILESLKQLIKFLLSLPDHNLQDKIEKIQSAVGRSGGVLTELIPEASVLLGPQPDIPELSPWDNQNRFNLVVLEFLRAVSGKDLPIVIFLDDLQWADENSLKLIDLFIRNKDLAYYLFIGSFRNDLGDDHPIRILLNDLRKEKYGCTELMLSELTEDDIRSYLSDLFGSTESPLGVLAKYLRKITDGNPFLIKEIVSEMAAMGLLVFDKTWKWDMQKIEASWKGMQWQDGLQFNVKNYSSDHLDLLKLFVYKAGGWTPFQLKAIFKGEYEVTEELLLSLSSDGLIEYRNGKYLIIHDKLQQRMELEFTDPEKKKTLRVIGLFYFERHKKDPENSELLFTAVKYLNTARDILVQEEMDSLTNLNFMAGERAEKVNAYSDVVQYFRTCLHLLGEDSWKMDPEKTFDAHWHLALAENQLGHYTESENICGLLLNKTEDPIIRNKIRCLQAEFLTVQMNYGEAMAICSEALLELGEDMNRIADPSAAMEVLDMTRKNLSGMSNDDILNLPVMTDPQKKSYFEILYNLLVIGASYKAEIFPVLTFRLINETLHFGLAPHSGYAFSVGGWMLLSMGTLQEADQFGKIGIQIAEKQKDLKEEGLARFVYAGSSCHAFNPLHIIQKNFITAIGLLKIGGDFSNLSYALMQYPSVHILAGRDLNECRSVFAEYESLMNDVNKEMSLHNFNLWRQLADDLRILEKPVLFDGPYFEEKKKLARFKESEYGLGYAYYCVAKVFGCLFLGNEEDALETINGFDPYIAYLPGSFQQIHYYFYKGVLLFHDCNAEGDASRFNEDEYQKLCDLMEKWAKANPNIYGHKHSFLQALNAEYSGRIEEAIAFFEVAEKAAGANGFLNEQALINEKTALFYLKLGSSTAAYAYLRKAAECYDHWGCSFKAGQLEKRYPEAFRHISLHYHGRKEEPSFYKDIDWSSIDAASVLKVSRSIAGEMDLELLSDKIMTVIIKSTGATRGVFILTEENEIHIEMDFDGNGIRGHSSGNDKLSDTLLPGSMIRYVQRTSEIQIIDKPLDRGAYHNNDYFRDHNPLSILCMPLIHKGKTTGVLYLENDLTEYAFKENIQDLLGILLPQVVISLENARLYKSVQDSLEEKNALIKELYHRTKNNMQMILSFLFLSASIPESAKNTQHLLRDMEGRIQAMALVHQKLYESQDLSQIDLGEYLNELTSSILMNFEEKYHPVSLEITCEEMQGLLDTAIPLGIIVNELMTNSLQHAFPQPGKSSLISIRMKRLDHNRILLEFEDNGIGVPNDFELYRQTGIGLQTVVSIVEKQLNGEIHWQGQHGLAYQISFDDTLYHQRI